MGKFKSIRKLTVSGNVYEVLGWIGVVLVLGSYFLLATGTIKGDAWLYHVMIFSGSAFLGIIAYIKHVHQAVVLNAVFCTLAVIALIRLLIF